MVRLDATAARIWQRYPLDALTRTAQVKWKPQQQHYIESTCENYRVSKAQVKGEIRYLSWQKNGKQWETVGEYSTNFKQAVSRFKEGR